MARYFALLDGEPGAYGVSFPDLPGCVAMGATVEDAMFNAADSLRDFVMDARAHGEDVPSPRSGNELMEDTEVREALNSGASLVSIDP